MPVLQKIAWFQGRRDEVPNQELAKELAESEDRAGIQEIAENLWHSEKNVRSDCLKVLYEVGYLRPELIDSYAKDFLKLLTDKNNRLVWGAMIALKTIASLRPEEIGRELDTLLKVVENRSVITQVTGVSVLAQVAAGAPQHSPRIFPFLLDQLKTCTPRDVPTHAESILPAVTESNRTAFLAAIEARRPEFSAAQEKRMKKVIKRLGW
jgi:hypothetical protein